MLCPPDTDLQVYCSETTNKTLLPRVEQGNHMTTRKCDKTASNGLSRESESESKSRKRKREREREQGGKRVRERAIVRVDVS